MAGEIAPGTWMQHRDDILARIKDDVSFLTNYELTQIDGRGVVLRRSDKRQTKCLPCDAVVFAVGVKSNNKLYGECKDAFENVFCVGDSSRPGRIAQATGSAFEAVLKID